MKKWDYQGDNGAEGNWPELFSIGVHATGTLRVQIRTTFPNGLERQCTTGQMYVPDYKQIHLMSEDKDKKLLGDCSTKLGAINPSNVKVRIVPVRKGSVVQAKKIDIGTDMSLSPSLSCTNVNQSSLSLGKIARYLIFITLSSLHFVFENLALDSIGIHSKVIFL